MSKRDLSSIASLAIVIMETKQRNGRFEARLDGDDRVLCVSRTPFFDAARELVANGYDPNLTLIMRHAGQPCRRDPAANSTQHLLILPDEEVSCSRSVEPKTRQQPLWQQPELDAKFLNDFSRARVACYGRCGR